MLGMFGIEIMLGNQQLNGYDKVILQLNMDFKYRYDLLVTFNHKIAEHFYSGDDFIGGITEETVREVFDNQGQDGFTFFPDLMNDIDSLFGAEEFETTRCDISANEITFYYSTHKTGVLNFEKKCLGWVMLKELDNAFCYYCIIDFENKDFIIRDANGGERRDKLKTIKIKDSQPLN